MDEIKPEITDIIEEEIPKKTIKEVLQTELDAREAQLINEYFHVDVRQVRQKYRDMYPDMFDCIIDKLVEEDFIQQYNNMEKSKHMYSRTDRRNLLKQIQKYNKKLNNKDLKK
jgi:hypothetical protein